MGFIDRYHNKYQTGGLQHLHASQIKLEVGPDIFGEYYKFTFVRNPWDRVISQFVTMQRRPDLRQFIGMRDDASLAEYLELIQTRKHVQWEPQYNFVHSEAGDLMVDFVGRLENFEADLRNILAVIGIRADFTPHTNRSKRTHYKRYYSRETRERVSEIYQIDIDWLGHRFED